MSSRFVVVLLFVVMWAAVTGSVSVPNLVLGLALALAARWLLRDPSQKGAEAGLHLHPLVAVRLAGLFVVELVKSGWRVARIAVRPRLELRPEVIAYPLTVTNPIEITLLANLVTLTPGTLSVDVSEDGRTLYVHCVDVDDPEAVIADIRDGFEATIRRTFA